MEGIATTFASMTGDVLNQFIGIKFELPNGYTPELVDKAVELYLTDNVSAHDGAFQNLETKGECLAAMPVFKITAAETLSSGTVCEFDADSITLAINAPEAEDEFKNTLESYYKAKLKILGDKPGPERYVGSTGKEVDPGAAMLDTEDGERNPGMQLGAGGSGVGPLIAGEVGEFGPRRLGNTGGHIHERQEKPWQTYEQREAQKIARKHFQYIALNTEISENKGEFTKGELFRQLMVFSGQGTVELAEKLGMSQGAVSTWNNDVVTIPSWAVARIVQENLFRFENYEWEDPKTKEKKALTKRDFAEKFIEAMGYEKSIIPGDAVAARVAEFVYLEEAIAAYEKGEIVTLPSLKEVMNYLKVGDVVKLYKTSDWQAHQHMRRIEDFKPEELFKDNPLTPEQIKMLNKLPFMDGEHPRDEKLCFANFKITKTTLGDFLEAWRESRGLVLEDVGKATGRTREAIRMLETKTYVESFVPIIGNKERGTYNPYKFPTDESGNIQKECVDHLHQLNIKGIYQAAKEYREEKERVSPGSYLQNRKFLSHEGFFELIKDEEIKTPRDFFNKCTGITASTSAGTFSSTWPVIRNRFMGNNGKRFSLPVGEDRNIELGVLKQWYNKFLREGVERGVLIKPGRGGR